MSYDLMVFDAEAAPRERKAFMEWYEQQTQWTESHGYNNPEIPTPPLRAWLQELIKTFPPMNGPFASDDPDDSKVTDYSLGYSVVYAAFAWSEAEAAYKHVKELAARHGVGFFDVSGVDGHIWWPEVEWRLSCEAKGGIPLPLELTFEEVLKELDSKKNSFFILENNNGNYMQCAGSETACTVEFRVYDGPAKYKHYVVGHVEGSNESASVKMSAGVVNVQKGEVLNAAESAELFNLFFTGKRFPTKYALREKDI